MAVMVVVAALAVISVFVNCTPFAATWNPAFLTTVSYIVSAIQTATDWACAIIPFFIVAGLQMSRRRKVSVLLTLGLGVLASIATCVRLPYLKYYDTAAYPAETMYHFGIIQVCSNVECGLGLVGCSLPLLRKLFKFYYGSSSSASEGNRHHASTGNSAGLFACSGRGIKLDSLTLGYDAQCRATAGRDLEPGNTFDDTDGPGRNTTGRKTEVRVSSAAYKD